jgi:3-phosphoshikimate 1-carboxyvinyltransferase
MVLGACAVPLTLTGVGLNPTRDALLNILVRMGAKITVEDRQGDDFEAYGTLKIEPSDMTNVDVFPEEIPHQRADAQGNQGAVSAVRAMARSPHGRSV